MEEHSTPNLASQEVNTQDSNFIDNSPDFDNTSQEDVNADQNASPKKKQDTFTQQFKAWQIVGRRNASEIRKRGSFMRKKDKRKLKDEASQRRKRKSFRRRNSF